MSSYDTITYEVDGHKATITLNRPEALNALSPHMVNELRTAYDEAEGDDNIWLMIVTGTGTDCLPFTETRAHSDQQPRMLTLRMTHALSWAEGHC